MTESSRARRYASGHPSACPLSSQFLSHHHQSSEGHLKPFPRFSASVSVYPLVLKPHHGGVFLVIKCHKLSPSPERLSSGYWGPKSLPSLYTDWFWCYHDKFTTLSPDSPKDGVLAVCRGQKANVLYNRSHAKCVCPCRERKKSPSL